MLKALGRVCAHHPVRVILVWLVVTAGSFALAFGAFGEGLFDRLATEQPEVPGSESAAANARINAADDSPTSVRLALTGLDLTDQAQMVDVGTAMVAVRDDLTAIDGVATVRDPFAFPAGPADPAAAPLLSTDADGFLVLVELEDGLTEGDETTARVAVEQRLGDVATDLDVTGVRGHVSSDALLAASIIDQVETDLTKGEAITLPLSLLVMVLVFGGFLSASMPIIGAIASIGSGMAMMYGASYLMNLDSYVVNVLTVIGLALSIDYGLLVVSRFREELKREVANTRPRAGKGRTDPAVLRASVETLHTAGRTVLFSAITIALSISGLLFINSSLLKAIASAGVAIVLLAVLSAITLVPASLALIGRRLLRPTVFRKLPLIGAHASALGDVSPDDGVFSRLARGVHRHPWLVLLPVLALLLFLASPLLSINLRSNTLEYVPDGTEQQAYMNVVDEKFPALQYPDIYIVADASAADATAWAAEIATMDHVERVNPVTELGEYQLISMRLDIDSSAPAAIDVVRELRDLEPGFENWVGGAGADLIDFTGALADGLPLAAGLVVISVFSLLFLMTGSVIVPLKALIINLLSLAASLGITVYVFQEGHLTGVLDFTPPGGMEVIVVALGFAFGFGLAMDYEVFLLSRIKEFWDKIGDNDYAVEHGLQKSGRIITSAALVMLLVFVGFVSGKLIVVKEIGFALAMTVLVDATLVRMLLVPSTMTILGTMNWWAPKWLKPIYYRFGITH